EYPKKRLRMAASNVSSGSRLCENAKAINRTRTSYSFKTVLGAYIASAFNFKNELKNIFLVALRTFELSHGLGHEPSFPQGCSMPAVAESGRDRTHRFKKTILPRLERD